MPRLSEKLPPAHVQAANISLLFAKEEFLVCARRAAWPSSENSDPTFQPSREISHPTIKPESEFSISQVRVLIFPLYGTTAVVCVQKGELLIIANVGDSKAILFRETALGASSLKKYDGAQLITGMNVCLSCLPVLQRPSPALQDQGGDLHDRTQGLLPGGSQKGETGERADWEELNCSPQREGAQAIRYVPLSSWLALLSDLR
jgi:hypothetical protein